MNDEGKLSKENALEMVKLSTKDDAEKEAAATEIVDKCEAIEVPEDQWVAQIYIWQSSQLIFVPISISAAKLLLPTKSALWITCTSMAWPWSSPETSWKYGME